MWLAMVVMAALIIVLLGVCCYLVWQKISIESQLCKSQSTSQLVRR
jgi:uncharacterized membrane protein